MWQELKLVNAELRLRQDFLPEPSATRLFHALSETVTWRRDRITLFGKSMEIPRLHQWFADDGLSYTWSGLTMTPQPWLDELIDIREQIEAACDNPFNSVLANLYRDGSDSMGWHADDEPELGNQPVIASLSLGAERDFVMRCRDDEIVNKQYIKLQHGSLLLMAGDTQRYWQHSLPKRRKISEPRINLTFRLIRPRS
ncbi:MAG: alpha-ketoglutarate-dependent dioxygenase AlkB [Gammaproteobacteria bacterium]